MKSFLFVAAGLLAVGVGYRSLKTPAVDTGGTPAMQAAADAVARYRILVPGAKAACSVVKGDRLSTGLARVRLSAGCTLLYPELAAVRYWREDAGGDVTFAGADGKPVVAFTVGDGVAYESYAPAAPLISLVAAD